MKAIKSEVGAVGAHLDIWISDLDTLNTFGYKTLAPHPMSHVAIRHRGHKTCNMRPPLTTGILCFIAAPLQTHGFATPPFHNAVHREGSLSGGVTSTAEPVEANVDESNSRDLFREFAQFLRAHQSSMIEQIERADGSGQKFSRDGWGVFTDASLDDDTKDIDGSGGITRVIQGGAVVEKGACSLTIIQNGKLTKERAETISARQEDLQVGEGDVYSAAALSVVLHTRNPFVPTFRSDVRIFLVQSTSKDGKDLPIAWFGGGSDLTPYYLIDDDIVSFHTHLKSMCDAHFPPNNQYNLSYEKMKQNCDDYFYLPARSEHRGTGGIFFDDLPATPSTFDFVKGVAEGWMPSWLPIVERNKDKEYSEQQKQWQCLRRGRYLEFNLLYDRGVKFGLANANPRVEGVMVSAPPMIAFEYNHHIEEGTDEERLVKVLKKPRDWV